MAVSNGANLHLGAMLTLREQRRVTVAVGRSIHAWGKAHSYRKQFPRLETAEAKAFYRKIFTALGHWRALNAYNNRKRDSQARRGPRHKPEIVLLRDIAEAIASSGGVEKGLYGDDALTTAVMRAALGALTGRPYSQSVDRIARHAKIISPG